MQNNKSNIGTRVALGIAIALFLGTAFYATKLYTDKKDSEAALRKEKALVMNDLSNMAKQYDLAISENEITNTKLEAARERIQGLIDSLNISEANVKSLWKYKKRYVALQKEMTVLLEENDRLKVENKLLATSLDSTRFQYEQNKMFTDSLLVQNVALSEVVKNAAELSTVGLKGFGVIERSSGRLIPTERARRADKIRVCFTVAKNNLIQPGEQQFYVQVIDPKNNILGENNVVEFEGDKVLNYSTISTFNYENENLDICEFVATNENGRFEKGLYFVNVFKDDKRVSTSQFELR